VVVATPEVEGLSCRGDTEFWIVLLQRERVGGASACGAKGASRPVLASDRSRCIE
jgi:hypothetical protein